MKEFRETVKVEVVIYNTCKYEPTSEVKNRAKYNISGYEVKQISDEDILQEADESCVDEYREYLILYFPDGDTSTFRNSHVDMFLINA